MQQQLMTKISSIITLGEVMIDLNKFLKEDSDYYKVFKAEQDRVKANYSLMKDIIAYIDSEPHDRFLDSLITDLYERIKND